MDYEEKIFEFRYSRHVNYLDMIDLLIDTYGAEYTNELLQTQGLEGIKHKYVQLKEFNYA